MHAHLLTPLYTYIHKYIHGHPSLHVVGYTGLFAYRAGRRALITSGHSSRVWPHILMPPAWTDHRRLTLMPRHGVEYGAVWKPRINRMSTMRNNWKQSCWSCCLEVLNPSHQNRLQASVNNNSRYSISVFSLCAFHVGLCWDPVWWIQVFCPSAGDSQRPGASCVCVIRPPVPFMWTWCLQNVLRQFLKIWYKMNWFDSGGEELRLLWTRCLQRTLNEFLKNGLIRCWWSKFKVIYQGRLSSEHLKRILWKFGTNAHRLTDLIWVFKKRVYTETTLVDRGNVCRAVLLDFLIR